MFEMDKCREAFERFECEKYECNYDDMKKNWDWYESQFGYRYSPDSLRGKDWAVWQKAWQHQQAKVEELQVQLKGAEERAQLTLKYKDKYREERDELQKRVNSLIKIAEELLEEMKYPTCTFEEVIVSGVKVLEQALKGEA